MDQVPTIYLIDDEPAVVRLVTRFLTDSGYRVVSFASGEEFLAQERLSDVGCVISDLYLPGIHGSEIQAHLQRINSLLTLIFISGQADVPTAVQLLKSGAINLLQKPFSLDQLLSAVNEGLTLNQRRLTQLRQSQDVQERLATLNEEEISVIRCLIKGMSRKAITSALDLSPRTLDRRQQSLLQKMGVNTVSELVAVCVVEPTFRDYKAS